MPKKHRTPGSDRVTYRDLRNTPGQVWERLAKRELLTLVADGEAKALLIPVEGGDVSFAYEAYTRGRAMLSAARLRRQARGTEPGAAGRPMTLKEINALIRSTRQARRRAARGK